ncbi:MAG: hypothetical protein ACI4AM_01380 [Muribaculaceae bacterium]
MKKLSTVALALLFCISSFAGSSIKFTDLTLGMSDKDFCDLLDNPKESDDIVDGYAVFESFSDSHFVGFFNQNALTEVSVCLVSSIPSDLKAFNSNFGKVQKVVNEAKSLKLVDSGHEFTGSYSEGDGREYQAICMGAYRRWAVYQDDATEVRISSSAQGIITLTITARQQQEPTVDDDQSGSAIDLSPFKINGQELDQTDSAAQHDDNESQAQQPTSLPDKQTNAPIRNKHSLYFQGLLVSGSAAGFANQLEDKGFTIANDSNPDQIFLKGTIDGIDDCEIYIINGNDKLISSITVYYPAHTQWDSLRNQYLKLKEHYDSDNTFKVTKQLEQWENGLDFGRGREMEGVSLDKCWYITNYDIVGTPHKATLYISKYARVALYYEVSLSPSQSGNRKVLNSILPAQASK